MKYKTTEWKEFEKAGEICLAVDSLYDELRLNTARVEESPSSKERTIVRNLYFSVAYKRHHIKDYSSEKMLEVLEELKAIRWNIKELMKNIK